MKTFDYIATYKGNKFWLKPDKLNENNIDIEEIAHSLSMTCRFNGHCLKYYSTAEHCVIGSHIIKEPYQLAFLLHDAQEYITGDISTPIKNHFKISNSFENKIQKLIYNKYGVTYDANLEKEVKKVDLMMLKAEAKKLMKFNSWSDELPDSEKQIKIIGFQQSAAKYLFLERFYQLYKGIN